MTKRTCNIIRACKGNLYPEIKGKVDRVRTYMSKECMCPLSTYTTAVTESIVVEAMCDYIDTCDKPSTFLRQVRDTKEALIRDLTLTERICIAFSLVQVKNGDGEYINGFDAEFLNGCNYEI